MPGLCSITLIILFNGMLNNETLGLSSPTNYLISGVVIMMVFQGALFNSNSVMEDLTSGFMKEIIVAPVKRSQIALGNILSAAAIGVVQGIIVLLFGLVLGFRIRFSMIVPILLLMIITAIIAAAGALLLSLLLKSQANYQLVSMFIMMPMLYLSGAYVPVTTLPAVLMPLVYINPLTYLTAMFRYVTLNLRGMDSDYLVSQAVAFRIGHITILPYTSFIVVVLIGAVIFIACVKKFEKVDLSSFKPVMRMRRA